MDADSNYLLIDDESVFFPYQIQVQLVIHYSYFQGLDFIMNCLQRCEMDRFGVEEALCHPWLAEHV
jgi:hypothetical protein